MAIKFEKSYGLVEKVLQSSPMAKELAAAKKSTEPVKEKHATLLRIETVFQNISDNLYNIGGVMNAQLTSMEETRISMKEQYLRQKREKEEALMEKKSGMLASKENEKAISDKLKIETPSKGLFDDILKGLSAILDAASVAGDLFDVEGKRKSPRSERRKRTQRAADRARKEALKRGASKEAAKKAAEEAAKKAAARAAAAEAAKKGAAAGAGRAAASVGARVVTGLSGVGTVALVGEAMYVIYDEAKDDTKKHKYYNELTGQYEIPEDASDELARIEREKRPKPSAQQKVETSEERLKRLGLKESAAGGGRGSYGMPTSVQEQKPSATPAAAPPKPAEPPKPTAGTEAEPLVKKISPETGKQAMLDEMDRQNITDPTKRAAIMAQAAVETGGFRLLSEDLRYSVPGLKKNFIRLKGTSDEELAAAVKQGALGVGTLLYGGDPSSPSYQFGVKNLGNVKLGDGPRYRGRGFFQLTGRANYTRAGAEDDPYSLLELKPAAKTAVDYANRYKGDYGDVTKFTKFVNGGTMHLKERGQFFEKFLNDPEIVEASISRGEYVGKTSAELAAQKRYSRPTTSVINVNNSTSTAVNVKAPQGGSYSVARPVG